MGLVATKGVIMARPGSDSDIGNGGLFGAPIESDGGVSQGSIDADLIILPGGILLVETSSPLANVPAFRCNDAKILCRNGRP